MAGAVLSLALVTLGEQVVQANYTSLSRFRCVSSGSGRADEDTRDVAIGRAVYKSIININPSNASAAFTCRIRPDNDPKTEFTTLDLKLGMQDRDEGSPAVVVNVYLDGVQSASRTISPGEAASMSLNITDTRNISIEATCSSRTQYCSRVYIYRAALQHFRPTPQPSK